jgi:shikimate kinase
VKVPGQAHPGHLVLVGMMGAGKSSLGQAVARLLERPFRDGDREVEARTGHTVAELFAEGGEAAFRVEEAVTLAALLADPTPSVIATGGGAVLDPTNRRLIRQAATDGGLVVWLRADPEVLAARVPGATHRPLLDRDPTAVLTELVTARAPLYAEVADLELDARQPMTALRAAVASAVTGREAVVPVEPAPAAEAGRSPR